MQQLDILFICDVSGSMQSVAGEMVDALNAIIDEQKTVTDRDIRVTYVTFSNTAYTYHRTREPIFEIQSIAANEYVCRGTTPLYHTVYQVIEEHSERIHHQRCTKHDVARCTQCFKTMVFIVTDGIDTSSYECKPAITAAQVKQLIERQSLQQWSFSYLSANLEQQGRQMGITGITRNVSADLRVLPKLVQRTCSEQIHRVAQHINVPVPTRATTQMLRTNYESDDSPVISPISSAPHRMSPVAHEYLARPTLLRTASVRALPTRCLAKQPSVSSSWVHVDESSE